MIGKEAQADLLRNRAYTQSSLDVHQFGGSSLRCFARQRLFNRDNNMNFLPLAIGAPGLPELVVIALIILLLFGGTKLPALMRNLGRSTNEFKRGMSETAAEDDKTDSQSEQV